jgi:hypothetical protein
MEGITGQMTVRETLRFCSPAQAFDAYSPEIVWTGLLRGFHWRVSFVAQWSVLWKSGTQCYGSASAACREHRRFLAESRFQSRSWVV